MAPQGFDQLRSPLANPCQVARLPSTPAGQRLAVGGVGFPRFENLPASVPDFIGRRVDVRIGLRVSVVSSHETKVLSAGRAASARQSPATR